MLLTHNTYLILYLRVRYICIMKIISFIYYFQTETSNIEKKKILPEIIRASTELIQYYSTVYNYPQVTKTFYEGKEEVKLRMI